MPTINPASIHTFVDGEVVTATDFNPSFSTIVSVVNDNYNALATNITNTTTNTTNITNLQGQDSNQLALLWMGGF